MSELPGQPIAAMPLGEAEACEGCGAPLAGDQRYCLECGRRRGGPRVDYRHYMVTTGEGEGAAAPASRLAPASETAAGPEEPAKPPRDYAPLAAVGGIAVLGLMLLVGVLIGKGGSSDTASAPAPVIRIPAGGASTEGGGESSPKKNTAGGLGLGGKPKQAKQSGGGAANTGSAVKASQGDLEALGAESGADYEKQSKELPNEIATPGKPPPIDKSTPPGGGEGGGEVIK